MSRLRRIRRATIVYWAVVAVLMFLTVELVGRMHASAQAAVAKHGTTEMVWVATRAIDAGSALGRGDVHRAEIPAAFLPRGAARGPDVVGQATTVSLVAGEVLLASRLAPSGVQGAAARVPRGSRGLAIPMGPGGPVAVEVGDRVDLLATFPPDLSAGGEPTFPVAEGAVVVDVSPEDDTVTVAVPAEAAARVAYAVAVGVVTLALTGWG